MSSVTCVAVAVMETIVRRSSYICYCTTTIVQMLSPRGARMNEVRTTRQTDSASARRAQRGVAGLVAPYVHQLAEGDRRNRVKRAAAPRQPQASRGAPRLPPPDAGTARPPHGLPRAA